MSIVHIDPKILQHEADKFVGAVKHYMGGIAPSNENLGAEFRNNVWAVKCVASEFVQRLQPLKPTDIVDVLNDNNQDLHSTPFEMLTIATREDLKNYDRFLELTGRKYVAQTMDQYTGKRREYHADHKGRAKQALHDILDAGAWYYNAARPAGTQVPSTLVDNFVTLGHGFIDADQGNVISLPARKFKIVPAWQPTRS